MNFLSIYNYRKFSGYVPTDSEPTYSGDILCVGTCDLYTIRPQDILKWTWAQRLSVDYSIDIMARHWSMSWYTMMIKKYLEKKIPKLVCFTVPVYCETVKINYKYYTLHENSQRVLKFLYIKKILNIEQYLELNKKVINIQQLSTDEKTLKSKQVFTEFVTVLEEYNIPWCWTFNATKTANKFYEEIVNEFDRKNFLGFIRNIDILPESSIGDRTQHTLYEKFLERIKKHDYSRCSNESPPTFTNISQILV